MRDITHIVIHCSATRPSQEITGKDIDRWHRKNGWLKIGYHFVIRRDGTLDFGRAIEVPGAHVKGHNKHTIGICLVGGMNEEYTQSEGNYTEAQRAVLEEILRTLRGEFKDAVVQGHRDFPGVRKACPSFDVKAWLQDTSLSMNEFGD